MGKIGERAVVIGASVGGLLAARALADAFDSVLICERDELPADDGGRRAVPQGRHGHALIARGQVEIDELLPGFRDELIEDGAATAVPSHDVNFLVRGHSAARVMMGMTTVSASRPFIEGHLRRRVLGLEGVALRRCDVTALEGDRRRVSGVRLAGAGKSSGEVLAADLVVAATGRSARLPAWLEQLGCRRPPEEELRIDLGYSSRRYRLPEGALVDKINLLGTKPVTPRGLALFAQEADSWIATLAGYGKYRPPSDEAGFAAFIEQVAPPHVAAALREGEPLDEIVTYRFRSNLRRRYDRMRRMPDGLLAIGDAMCSFNPLYGQGMTVAAIEASLLRSCLTRGPRGLGRRYFRATKRPVGHAWQMAIGADLAQPVVDGRRSSSWRLSNAYTERVMTAAERDGDVMAPFTRVVGLFDPPSSLLRPAIARKVLIGRRDAYAWPGHPPRTPVRRRKLRVDGLATPIREAGSRRSSEAVVFLHGVPGSAADFEPLLAAAGQIGRAIAWDAPGFGKADKPDDFDHSVAGHAAFLDRVLAELGVDRVHLVMHDFGGPWGLEWTIENAEKLASVTLLGTGVPLDYRWHRTARIWRTPVLGELAMATLTRAGMGASLRRSGPRRLPSPLIDRMYEDLDAATRRAILRLYRSADDPAGEALRLVEALRPLDLPAMVIWGDRDPYVPAALAERQREAFPRAEVHVLEQSGHWLFVDSGERVEELLLGHLQRVSRPAVSTV
jgi:pimeloyl-ACP methyl ester carboxylesterase/2-polyprenyl-6-methoxyphenol hydroxylase-like FAD-dependent oxidoreductase